MKTQGKLVFCLIALFLLAVAASAQDESLKDLTDDDVFHSKEDGFEIALPAELVQKGKVDNGRTYDWDFKEGSISVVIRHNLSAPASKTDADIAKFLKGVKQTMTEGMKATLLSETPARIGEYRGAAYLMTIDGHKTLLIALAWEKFTVAITGAVANKLPASEKLVFEAVQSFEFVH